MSRSHTGVAEALTDEAQGKTFGGFLAVRALHPGGISEANTDGGWYDARLRDGARVYLMPEC